MHAEKLKEFFHKHWVAILGVLVGLIGLYLLLRSQSGGGTTTTTAGSSGPTAGDVQLAQSANQLAAAQAQIGGQETVAYYNSLEGIIKDLAQAETTLGVAKTNAAAQVAETQTTVGGSVQQAELALQAALGQQQAQLSAAQAYQNGQTTRSLISAASSTLPSLFEHINFGGGATPTVVSTDTSGLPSPDQFVPSVVTPLPTVSDFAIAA